MNDVKGTDIKPGFDILQQRGWVVLTI